MQIIDKIKVATGEKVFNGVHYGLTIVSILFALALVWCLYADALGLGGN